MELFNNKKLHYLIRILWNVIETDESRDELAVEEVMGVINGPQTPVCVVVWVWTQAERTICQIVLVVKTVYSTKYMFFQFFAVFIWTPDNIPFSFLHTFYSMSPVVAVWLIGLVETYAPLIRALLDYVARYK